MAQFHELTVREVRKTIRDAVVLTLEPGNGAAGEFDFTQDKVLAHGRPPMAALSRASRRWLNVELGNLPEPWVEP